MTLTFAVGAALVSLALGLSVSATSKGFLTNQRETTAERQTGADARFVRTQLSTSDRSPEAILTALDPPAGTVVLLRWQGRWHSSEPGTGPDALPDDLVPTVSARDSTTIHTTMLGAPFLAVGVPIGESAALYELVPLDELASTLRVVNTALVSFGVAATLGAAVVGLWASRRVLHPLHQLARTAAEVAGGDLDTRLPPAHDRDLAMIGESFNSMVDSLERRIERESRFVADVSHELRTPLTTLVASVDVLRRYRDLQPSRSREALDLVVGELHHLHRLVEHLLALARTEAGLHQDQLEPMSLRNLVGHVLAESGRPAELLTVEDDSTVMGRKLALERAFVNLMDNADRHGGGLVGVTVRRDGDQAVVLVDDAGPGVREQDRETIFERFTTGRTPRGTTAGTGLGLALVAETVAAHGGRVHCEDRPGRGARLVVNLPATVPAGGG